MDIFVIRDDKTVFRILTAPFFERWRAQIPYPLFVWGMMLVLGFPLLLLLGKLDLTGMGILSVWPILLVFISALGWISGYRSFRFKKNHLTIEEKARIAAEIKANVIREGFKIVWDDAERGFVGIKDMHLELNTRKHLHSGQAFPMRLAFFHSRKNGNRGGFHLRLGVRTVVIWDSGEKAKCYEVGERILKFNG